MVFHYLDQFKNDTVAPGLGLKVVVILLCCDNVHLKGRFQGHESYRYDAFRSKKMGMHIHLCSKSNMTTDIKSHGRIDLLST